MKSPPPDFSLFTPLLRQVAELGAIKRYRRGSLLMHEGEPGGTLFFVLDGLLRSYTARDDGQEYTYNFHGPGEILGEVSLDGGTRSAHVIVERAATCSFVTRNTLEACIGREPALAFEIFGLLAQRTRQITAKARELALTDAYGRLVLLLRAGSQPLQDGRLKMGFALTQSQMAQQIGCSRPMVNKLLKALERGGYLRRELHGSQRVWTTLKPLPDRF